MADLEPKSHCYPEMTPLGSCPHKLTGRGDGEKRHRCVIARRRPQKPRPGAIESRDGVQGGVAFWCKRWKQFELEDGLKEIVVLFGGKGRRCLLGGIPLEQQVGVGSSPKFGFCDHRREMP